MPSKQVEVGTIVLLPPDRLTPMRHQPRTEFDMDTMRAIADSVIDLRSRGLGLMRTGYTDALMVRLPSGAIDKEGHLREGVLLPIVSGETRWRAALLANERQPHSIPELPCAIENVSDADALELAYFANAHRKDLSDLDEAQFLLRWKNRQKLTLQELANRTHKTLGYIQNRIDVIGAGEDVLEIFDERPKALSMVRRIDTVTDPERRRALIQLAKEGVSLKVIEAHIKAHNTGLSVEKYQALKEIEHYHRKGEKEAAQAAKTSYQERDEVYDVSEIVTAMLRQSDDALQALHGASLTARERRTLAAQINRLEAAVEKLKNAPALQRIGHEVGTS